MDESHARFYVDAWLVEPRLNRIIGQGKTQLVEPKVMQVLMALAEQPGEVFGRDRLLDHVWGDTVVTDHVLTRSISELRKIFGDDPREPTYIETIPKTGYRLIAPVQHPSAELSSDGAPPDLRHGGSPPRSADDLSVTPRQAVAGSRPRFRLTIWHALVLLLGLLTLAAWWTRPPHTMAPLPTTLFTSFPGLERQPAFSPDGKQVAFSRTEADGMYRLYTKLLGSETLLPLSPEQGHAFVPAWSPDGRYVAYRYRNEEEGLCGFYIVDALGGSKRLVADCTMLRNRAAWTPDGSALIVTRRASPESDGAGLSFLDVRTGALRLLTTPDTPLQWDFHPVVSPDGRYVAFVRAKSESMGDVHILRLDAPGEPQRLTFDNRHIAGLAWGPNSTHLVFSSNRAGNYKLWRLPAAGGEPEWMAAVGAYDPGNVTISPDGRHLVYEEWFFEINLWEADPATPDALHRVIASTRWDYHPHVSPDGRRVAFASNRTSTFEIWTADRNGDHARRLTEFGGPFVSAPRWSPDGARIAFDARIDGHAAVFVMQADGSGLTRLTGPDSHALVPNWSADGQWIYFASGRGGEWNVWKVPAASGKAVQVTRDGGYRAFESEDGAALFFTRYGEKGLWQMPASGGTATKLLDAPSGEDWGNWTLSKASLFYLERTPKGPVINRYDINTQQIEPFLNLSGRILSHEQGFDLAPDGRLLLAFADRVESDLVLVTLE